MRQSSVSRKLVAAMVVVAFSFLTCVVAPLQAAMVGTEQILTLNESQAAREKIDRFLERQDVASQMGALGLSMAEAQARVDAMTDEEISLLAGRIDQLPAGGSVIGFVLGLAAVAFVVLIILDIAGVTDIFTFIKKR